MNVHSLFVSFQFTSVGLKPLAERTVSFLNFQGLATLSLFSSTISLSASSFSVPANPPYTSTLSYILKASGDLSLSFATRNVGTYVPLATHTSPLPFVLVSFPKVVMAVCRSVPGYAFPHDEPSFFPLPSCVTKSLRPGASSSYEYAPMSIVYVDLSEECVLPIPFIAASVILPTIAYPSVFVASPTRPLLRSEDICSSPQSHSG